MNLDWLSGQHSAVKRENRKSETFFFVQRTSKLFLCDQLICDYKMLYNVSVDKRFNQEIKKKSLLKIHVLHLFFFFFSKPHNNL